MKKTDKNEYLYDIEGENMHDEETSPGGKSNGESIETGKLIEEAQKAIEDNATKRRNTPVSATLGTYREASALNPMHWIRLRRAKVQVESMISEGDPFQNELISEMIKHRSSTSTQGYLDKMNKIEKIVKKLKEYETGGRPDKAEARVREKIVKSFKKRFIENHEFKKINGTYDTSEMLSFVSDQVEKKQTIDDITIIDGIIDSIRTHWDEKECIPSEKRGLFKSLEKIAQDEVPSRDNIDGKLKYLERMDEISEIMYKITEEYDSEEYTCMIGNLIDDIVPKEGRQISKEILRCFDPNSEKEQLQLLDALQQELKVQQEQELKVQEKINCCNHAEISEQAGGVLKDIMGLPHLSHGDRMQHLEELHSHVKEVNESTIQAIGQLSAKVKGADNTASPDQEINNNH